MNTTPVERDPLFPQSSSPTNKNMKVDIPSGNEAAEKKTMEQQAPESAYTNVKASKNKSLKTLIFVAGIVVFATVAIVVALVPDWKKTTTDVNENGSQSAEELKLQNPVISTNNQTFFESDEGPFHIKLPLMSSNITHPYSSVEEAKHDLEQLAKFEVNRAIKLGNNANKVQGEAAGPEMAFESEAADSAGGASDSAFAGVSDFGTYQQEAGVVRSDFVKSDGEHVFAVVEDKILVWNLEGDILQTIVMPLINATYEGVSPVKEPVEVVEGIEGSAKQDGMDANTTADSRSSLIWWNPKPYVQALLLNSDSTKLTVIVSGYGLEYTEAADVIPVIQDYKGTRMIVYDIADDGSLVEVSKTDINGYHVDSYSVGDNVHVVTKTGLRTWEYLIQPLQRWMPEYEGMSDEEYEVAAILKAEAIIPVFVDKVLDLYTLDGEVVLARLAVFANSVATNDTMTGYIFDGGIANSITEISSFDVSEADASNTLSISTSATLQPGYWGYVYATTDWIWVADQGWRWMEDKNTYVQDTVLLGFRLLDASSTFSVVGSIPGSLLSQFSVDFYRDPETSEEYIRAATTMNFEWRLWWGFPENPDTVNEEDTASRTKNQVIILKVPSLHNGDQVGDELEQLGSVELGKKDEVSQIAKELYFVWVRRTHSSPYVYRQSQLFGSLTIFRTS